VLTPCVFAVHAGTLPCPGEVGPVRDHVPGQGPVSGEVEQRGGKGFTKQVLQVLGVLSLHPARQSWDTSLHVEQVGVGTGSTRDKRQHRYRSMMDRGSQDPRDPMSLTRGLQRPDEPDQRTSET